jgi:hypothetical protein
MAIGGQIMLRQRIYSADPAKTNMMIKTTILAAAISLMVGCTTMKKGFVSSERANLSPFAEKIIVILGDSDYGLTKDETVRIRSFFDLDSPEALKLILLQQQIRSLNKGIVKYSVDVVSLSETQKTQKEQVAAFADYIDTFEKPIFTHLKITEEEYTRLLESIRKQDSLLGALRTAQPVISAAARYGETIISEIEMATFALVLAIESKIDAHNSEILAYHQTLEDHKKSILQRLNLIQAYHSGDSRALQKLRADFIIGSNDVISGNKIISNDPANIEYRLMDRLNRIQKIGEQIAIDVEDYRESHRELDQLYERSLQDLSNARKTFMIWSKAHYKMALGLTDPAKWFDIADAPSELFRLGTRTFLK